MFKLYNRLVKSAYNLSIFRTLMYNILVLKTLKPKLYLGKNTSIINKGGEIIIKDVAFFDCKNSGQFFHDSHIVLMENSKLKLGHNINFFSGAQIKCFEGSTIEIGDDTYFSGPIVIHSKKRVKIGKKCAISWGVTIMDSNFHSINDEGIKTEDVIIEDDVWIGCNVTILEGVHIPKGSIIAAGSIVTKKLVKKGIYTGNIAKLVRLL